MRRDRCGHRGERSSSGWRLCAVSALPAAVGLLGAVSLAAGQDKPTESPANYGRTPDTAIPYRNFADPYLRFFQTTQEFLGTGRETPIEAVPERVRIGFFAPLGEAPDADLGQEMLDGVRLAVEQANERGGYRGSPYELIVREDSGLWGATSNEMAAFKYEDDVLAVIGSIDGANTHIALRVALKTQTPMVNTGSTDPTLTETNIPWLLRCMADDRQQGYALAYAMFEDLEVEHAVAFRVNDRYGRMGIAEFSGAARRLRHPLRAELRWDRGERRFENQLDRIEQLDPDAIVLWGNAADLAAVVREIRRRGIPARLFACDRAASRAFLQQAGDAAEGLVAAASYDPTRDDTQLNAFRAAFEAEYGRTPGTFAAHAYDGANILMQAIDRAGPNRALIRDALYDLPRFEGVTGEVPFDTTKNDVGPVYLATVENGRLHYREATYGASQPAQAASGVAPYRTLAESAPGADVPVAEIADDRLTLGCFLPLDEQGMAAVRGIKLALAADVERHPDAPPIQLLVRDARGPWGERSGQLVDLVFEENVVAVIGSTERRGTHLAEMLAAKTHFPVVSLCGDDPTITQIPLPWIFSMASAAGEFDGESLGYDAAWLLATEIRSGATDRKALRDALADGSWREGRTGRYRFDALGNRIDRTMAAWKGGGSVK